MIVVCSAAGSRMAPMDLSIYKDLSGTCWADLDNRDARKSRDAPVLDLGCSIWVGCADGLTDQKRKIPVKVKHLRNLSVMITRGSPNLVTNLLKNSLAALAFRRGGTGISRASPCHQRGAGGLLIASSFTRCSASQSSRNPAT